VPGHGHGQNVDGLRIGVTTADSALRREEALGQAQSLAQSRGLVRAAVDEGKTLSVDDQSRDISGHGLPVDPGRSATLDNKQ